MLRALVKLIFVVVLLVVAGSFLLGYRWDDVVAVVRPAAPVAGTTGTEGAELGEKVAAGAARVTTALDETRLTAKVKSKIGLDDTLDGIDVSVHTSGTTVTVEGRVSSAAQHDRVLQLVRETQGVTGVVDRIRVQ
jgi:hyperosmotically inducible protein